MIFLNRQSRYRLSLLPMIAALLSFSNLNCGRNPLGTNRSSGPKPSRILWAWERQEDLRFLDTDDFGVAFLAQTIYLQKDKVSTSRRKQPLKLPENVLAIAVTRIETEKSKGSPDFTDAVTNEVVKLIGKTLKLPEVKGVQIDFDAVTSERIFYRGLITRLRSKLPKEISLTITALASWCMSDSWISGLPVDDAIPMLFQMGPDGRAINAMLKNEIDFKEPLCRQSYGLSIDEPLNIKFKPGRRFFYFSRKAWRPSDLLKLEGINQE